MKRISLNDRRASDRKGVDAFFDSEESAVEPVHEKSGAKEKQPLQKITLYIRPDQAEALEEIQFSERKRTGKKPKKTQLVQEAFDLLIEKYSNTETQ